MHEKKRQTVAQLSLHKCTHCVYILTNKLSYANNKINKKNNNKMAEPTVIIINVKNNKYCRRL